MSDIDRIYQLFAEANPAPANSTPVTERPDAETILREQRKPTMLTREPRTIEAQPPPPRLRRWRGPAIALGTFVGAAILGVAAWLVVANGDSDVADGGPPPTTLPPVTTTTLPDVVVPGVVPVPDLSGLTLAEARRLLADAGLDLQALGDDIDSAIVMAQEPAAGVEVDEGTAVTVDARAVATCNPPDPLAPGPGEVIITIFYECGNDDVIPTPGIGVPRIVPENGGEAIDRIEGTLRSLLAGPTNDERIVGVVSGFDAATAGALNGVTLTGGRLVVDFNDAIIINNMGTATGMVQFNAELHRNVFPHPEVDSVEFHLNGDCEAWSALFEADGCRVKSRADWEQDLADWDQQRNQ
ncbi:MAG: PASTA domain-containing protein [Acidimicrobiia bacterium]|nr:PASTA domain-containing protein [Acidimicrobiia bacterium]